MLAYYKYKFLSRTRVESSTALGLCMESLATKAVDDEDNFYFERFSPFGRCLICGLTD